MNKNIGRLNRKSFTPAHSNTTYVQAIFPELDPADIRTDTFAYPPCWGILDAGMTMEKHRHPIPEFYVFVQGNGEMTLGSDVFAVTAGMSVNIPRGCDHEVTNAETAVEPLIWVSIGLKEEPVEPSDSGDA
jgi:mannose-6-phosphate isomerase-like protein (cupin superfamily)